MIPDFTGQILYGLGTKADLGTGLEWFERRKNGVYRLGEKSKLSDSALTPWLIDRWQTLAEWAAAGCDPRADYLRTFETSLHSYWLRSAADICQLGRDGLIAEGIFGRRIYFLCLRPKVRFGTEQLRQESDGSIALEIVIHLAAGPERVPLSLRPDFNPLAANLEVAASPRLLHLKSEAGPQQAFTVWGAAQLAGLDQLLPLHVIYIGQSIQIQRRLLFHEKVQLALARWGDELDVMVLTCTFEEAWITLASPLPNFVEVIRTRRPIIGDRRQLDVIEKALICHFDPELNHLEKNSPIRHKRSAAQVLNAARCGKVSVHFEPDPPLKLGSTRVVAVSKHHFEEDFANQVEKVADIKEFEFIRGLFKDNPVPQAKVSAP